VPTLNGFCVDAHLRKLHQGNCDTENDQARRITPQSRRNTRFTLLTADEEKESSVRFVWTALKSNQYTLA
jgi:hypothetical protein